VKTQISTWLLNSSILITIYFVSRVSDPFNSPKFWVLIVCAAFLSGPILTKKIMLNQTHQKLYRVVKIVISLFIIFSIVSTFRSYDVQTSILGESFRRNGLLTMISFSLIFFGAIKFIRFQETKKIFNAILLSSLIVGGYAVIQITKNDFVSWSNPNAIITTLGNTNFAGAAMAIFTILCFGRLFFSSTNSYYKLTLFGVIVILLIAIRATQARQAIIILILGVSLILMFQIYNKNAKLGKSIFVIFIPVGILSILGMLQIGPLQALLYKGSLSIRGYYWRAGLEMFMNNPAFGVGIDNYGKFFKEFREVNYTLNYGFSITSTNAHNIYIQYFATGGLFVGLAYLTLQIIVLYCSIKLIFRTQNDDSKVVVTLFAAWVAFQAQSLVSIENLGGSIWGWLISGSLIGLYFSNEDKSNTKKSNNTKSIEIKWKSSLISGASVILVFFLVIQLYSGERNTYLTQAFTAPESTDPKIRELFNSYAQQALNSKFIDNDYKNVILSSKFEMGYRDEALKGLEEIIKLDPRNLDTLDLLALGNEKIRNFEKGIMYRKEIARYDPWNAQNYLALGLVYKYIQDYDSMQVMLNKILSFAANDPIAITAKNELFKPAG
jgi:tetratricopeptide (TPR) repeat protein